MFCIALAALTITLFILNQSRRAERADGAAERLETHKSTNAMPRHMLETAPRTDLAVVMIFVTACVGVDFESPQAP